jgi:hypothetical protein
MEFSDKTDKLFPALFEARKHLAPKIGKNATANTGKFKYDYVTLEEVMEYVRPACDANGLMIIQGSATHDYDEKGAVAVATAIVHVASGQFVKTRFAAEVGPGTPAQQAGIVISYGRRYEVFGLFGLTPVGEDTDANGSGAKIEFRKSAPSGKFKGRAVSPATTTGSGATGNGNSKTAPKPTHSLTLTTPITSKTSATKSTGTKKPGSLRTFGKSKETPAPKLPAASDATAGAFSYKPKD